MLYTTATSESSQTCSFFQKAGQLREFLQLPQELGRTSAKATGMQGQVEAVSSDPRGSVGCYSSAVPVGDSTAGPDKSSSRAKLPANLRASWTTRLSKKRHQILEVEGSKNESSIARTVQTLREKHRFHPGVCSRELHSGKLGSSKTANPGQRIHSPKEWAVVGRFQLQKGRLCCMRAP